MAAHPRLLVTAFTLVLAACTAPGPTPPPTPSQAPPAGSPTTSVPTPRDHQSPAPGSPSPGAQPSPAASPAGSPTPGQGNLGDGPLAWSELDVEAGPSAREDHTFTVDATGESAYLFGGRAGNDAFADLWRYDLAAGSWQEIDTGGIGPEPRFGHVAAWADGLGLVIWSGQQSANVFFSDTWLFDPAAGTWQQLPDGGAAPPARYGSCGAIGPDGRLWISHGFTEDSGRFFDTQAYDFAAGTWTDVTPAGEVPIIRCLHDCLWTPDGQFMLYAGQTTGAPAIGDLWSLDSGDGLWTQAEQPSAPPRQLYALAQLGETAFVFGGGTADGGFLDDLWRLDLDTLAMEEADVTADGPSARFGAAMIADAARGRLLLFGGEGEDGELGDVWQLAAAP
jgi:hypothetical protein